MRWAVVSALSNYMEDPSPTIAGKLIFDSKVEPVEGEGKDQVYPMCVVYTDYDHNGPPANSYKKDERTVTITFEMFIGAFKKSDDGFQLELPNTDLELDFSLDMLEAQVFRSLHGDSKACDAYRSLIDGYDNVISRRGASAEGGHKIAARQITIEVECARDPLVGKPCDEVAAFLDELKSRGEYGAYVDELLEAYKFGANLPTATQHAIHRNYPMKVRDVLGITRPDAPVSKQPAIIYLNADGNG